MAFYQTSRTTPFVNLRSKDLKYINIASYQAEKSSFDSSLRLGACIQVKGSCILWGEHA